MGLQSGNQLAGDFPVVDVGPDFGAGRGHFLLRIAPLDVYKRQAIKRALAARAAETIVMASQEKLNSASAFAIGELSLASTLIIEMCIRDRAGA